VRSARPTKQLKDCYESLKAFILALGDDVQLATMKFYFAFKCIKNLVHRSVITTPFIAVSGDLVELNELFTLY